MSARIIRTHIMPANTGLAFFPGLILLGKNASKSLEAHELRHKDQQARDGWLLWTLRYAFSMHWRLEYEAEAYAVSVHEKFKALSWREDIQTMIENEASNLRYYNLWLLWKPTIELSVSRIRYYFDIEKARGS